MTLNELKIGWRYQYTDVFGAVYDVVVWAKSEGRALVQHTKQYIFPVTGDPCPEYIWVDPSLLREVT